ncbi:MAG: T9SS type A sorting domain-containing protein, partial [Rhodothermales bacterium]
GNETLEDAWFSLWADQLLYDPQDNFIGSDSLLGLGYAYNGDDFDEEVFGDTPPAVGLDFLKGPVPLPDGLDNDSDGVVDEPGERGGATRFLMHSHNNTVDGWPRNAKEAYDLLRGIWRDGTPLTYGGQGYGGRSRAHFMYSGNPPAYWSEENAQGQGWGNSPGYRHFNISTGPFRMEPGESEDIYLGILWARGRDRLDSVRKLKAEDAVIQSIFEELIEPNLPAFTKPAPPGYALVHNYPNPFRGRTTFSYELPRQERVRLTVYDVLGREIETLVDGVQPPGVHQIEFEAGDLPPGIYFYELQAGLVRGAHKMVLLP